MRHENEQKNVFADILATLSKYFVAIVIIMLIIILFSGVRFVRSGNVALVLRFGNLVGDTYEEQIHEPGLLLAFPYIIDEVVMVPTGSVIEQKVMTHFSNGEIQNLSRESGYLVTGDQNIAVISATIKYNITDAVAYALNVKDVEDVINASVSNAMVKTAACMKVDDILTSQKEEYIKTTMQYAQSKLYDARVGITIKNLELTNVSMPKEVIEVYEGVHSASVYGNTLLEEAYLYEDTMVPWAESEADSMISEANSDYSETISKTNQRLAEFWGLLEEFKMNKEVVRLRIRNEKISEVISKIGKIKIVQDGESKIIIE